MDPRRMDAYVCLCMWGFLTLTMQQLDSYTVKTITHEKVTA